MGEKSAQKKQLIIEKARDVFAEKGYKEVTMKDIVDACDISRGGLYLYFSSTEELFLEVLKAGESKDEEEAVGKALEEGSSAGEMLALFMKEQKKDILRRKNLIIATYEYFFAHKLSGRENPLRKQFDTGVIIVKKLIEDGNESGEFYCENPLGFARNIMYVLEGLRIVSRTMGVTEETVDREIVYLVSGLVPEEA